jgi:hypothetical protein
MFYFIKKLICKQPSSSCCSKAINPAKAPRYAVYIYFPNSHENGGAQWRKVGATNCEKRAVKQALLLHKKQEYQSVEVKKCSYHKSEDYEFCKTIRVYNKKRSSPLEKYIRSLSASS